MPVNRIVFKSLVKIDSTKHPELAEELSRIEDTRAHAERLRALATWALKLQAGGVALSATPITERKESVKVTKDEMSKRRERYGQGSL